MTDNTVVEKPRHKYYVAVTNPDTYSMRKVFADTLVKAFDEYVDLIIDIHRLRNDMVQDIGTYRGSNVSNYAERYTKLTTMLEAKNDEVGRLSTLAGYVAIPEEAAGYRWAGGKNLHSLIYKLERISEADWGHRRIMDYYPAGTFNSYYPMHNKSLWNYLYNLRKAVKTVVYNMFVSVEEQAEDKRLAEESFVAYEAEQDAIYARSNELSRMNTTDLVIELQKYINAFPDVKFPKPQCGRASYNKGCLTNKSEGAIKKAILAVDYPMKDRLSEPSGYKAWKQEQYEAEKRRKNDINKEIAKLAKAGKMEEAIEYFKQNIDDDPIGEVLDHVDRIVFSQYSDEELKAEIMLQVKAENAIKAIDIYKKYYKKNRYLNTDDVIKEINEWVDEENRINESVE